MNEPTSLDISEPSASALLNNCATAISTVCTPPMLALALVWLVAEHAASSPNWALSLTTLALLLGVLPALFVVVGHWLGYIGDLDLSKRSERMGPALFAAGCAMAAQPVLAVLQSPPLLTSLAQLVALQLALLALLTNWWRISYHSASIATVALAALALQGMSVALPLLALASLVGWSRVRLRRHTVGQVVAGLLSATPALFWSWPFQ